MQKKNDECILVIMPKPKNERVKLLSIRVPDSVHQKIDRFREKLERELPGSKPSLSDAVRVLVERGLEAK